MSLKSKMSTASFLELLRFVFVSLLVSSVQKIALIYVLLNLSVPQGTSSEISEGVTSFITHGDNAPPGRFPYMCSLSRRGNRQHGCGGFLMDRQWMVTAAHCVDPDTSDSLGPQPIINCGLNNIEDADESNILHSIETHIHESWNGKVENGYDIAMLKLKTEVPWKLPELAYTPDSVKYGTNVFVLGWGEDEEGQIETYLQVGMTLFVPRETCNETPLWDGLVKEHQICAGLLSSDTCRGDSGGPLLLADEPQNLSKGSPSNDLIVGITSYGWKKCDSSKPGVFTDIGYFDAWIQEIIKSDRTQVPTEPTTPTTPTTSPVEVIEKNDFVVLEEILKEGLDPNYRDPQSPSNDTLLHLTARFHAFDCTKVLFKYEAEIDITNTYGETPLYHCAKFSSPAIAKFLLGEKANPNVENRDKWTPLHEAALSGRTDIINLLIQYGANLEAKDITSLTPLHVSCQKGQVNATRFIIDKGANIEAREGADFTPLHLASRDGHSEIVQILCDNEADVNPRQKIGFTPLHVASQGGHAQVAQILIDHKADIDAPQHEDYTPLHFAASDGHSEVVEVLIDNGANIEAVAEKSLRWRPLQVAAVHDQAEILEILLRNGANIDAGNIDDWTALHEASNYGNPASVKTIAEISLRSLSSFWKLMFLFPVEVLIEHKANVNAIANDLRTPLHIAALFGYTEIIETLSENRASKDMKDVNDQRPFDLICQNPKEQCTKNNIAHLEELLA